jgi:hypothetical protein
MGYGGTPATKLAWQFGDGSDGELHLSASGNPTKAEYNFTALTIDAGVTWAQQLWAAQGFSHVIIRCQTPIVLNGSLSADAVACTGMTGWQANGGWNAGVPYGLAPAEDAISGGYAGWSRHILPIQGGPTMNSGNIYVGSYEGYEYYPTDLYNALKATDSSNDVRRSSGTWSTRAAIQVGPDRRFLFAAGCGGGADGNEMTEFGGNGGGAWIIYATAVTFGAAAGVTARGSDGDADAVGSGCGGGGGGSVQFYTTQDIAVGDLAKCDVSGGSGTGVAYDGHAGLVMQRRI